MAACMLPDTLQFNATANHFCPQVLLQTREFKVRTLDPSVVRKGCSGFYKH